MNLTVGVLALQGAFHEHITLLKQAANALHTNTEEGQAATFSFIEVRTVSELDQCDALVIPGGESTSMSLVAARSGLLESLRDFVKVKRRPTWGTCAGLILLAESANRTKQGGQELIGGLDVRVNRNHFGRQTESFQAPLDLPFLKDAGAESTDDHPFPGIFIRAPVVEKLLPVIEGVQESEERRIDTVVAPSKATDKVEVMRDVGSGVNVLGVLPGRAERLSGQIEQENKQAGDIVAVRQGNVFGTSFHPELTTDMRIHLWWLKQLVETIKSR